MSYKRPLDSESPTSSQRSKMSMKRTPQKADDPGNSNWNRRTGDDSLKAIQEMLTAQTEVIRREIHHSIESLRVTVDSKFKELEEKIDEMDSCNKELQEKNAELEKRITKMELNNNIPSGMSQRLLYLERSARKLNIVATGIACEDPSDGFSKLNNAIGVATEGKVQVEGIRILQQRSGKPKIIASCKSLPDKRLLMQNKKRLATIDDKKTPIFVDDDLPPEDRSAQARLREIAREKKSNGHEVRVAFRRLKIDGEWHFFNESSNQLETNSFRTPSNRLLEHPRTTKEDGGNQ